MSERRCLMVVPVFPPRTSVGVFRSLRFCRNLPAFGWIPSVCTLNSRNEVDNDPLSFELDKRSRIVRVGVCADAYMPTKNHQPTEDSGNRKIRLLVGRIRGLLRPYRELLFETPDRGIGWVNSVKRNEKTILDSTKPDLVYSSGPPHSTHLAAMHLAKKAKIPWIADFRDPWARLPWVVSHNPIGRKWIIPGLEKQVVQTASTIVVNNDSSKEDFCKAYPDLAWKFHTITNGIDRAVRDRIRDVLAEYSTDGERSSITICHAGSLYGHRDPSLFLKALAQVRSTGVDIRFQQVGPIDETFNVVGLCQELGIKNAVDLVPSLPHAEALKKMAAADILLIIQPDAPVMVPAKLFEMMIFQKPIIGVCDSPSSEEIIAAYGGYSAASQDIVKIREVIELSVAQLERDSYQKDARRLATCEQYDGVRLTGVLAAHMDRLVSEKN